MTQLVWSEEFELDQPVMDAVHREFVDLLTCVQNASDEVLLQHWKALVDHTHDHFEQENQWMQATGFAADNCHSTQHHIVLQVMREGLQRGELSIIRQMAEELTVWFPHHAQMMDAALAQHLQQVGYDPATNTMTHAHAMPQQAIHGCGGGTCA